MNSVYEGSISGGVDGVEGATINSNRVPEKPIFLPDLGEINLTFLAKNGVGTLITLLVFFASEAKIPVLSNSPLLYFSQVLPST